MQDPPENADNRKKAQKMVGKGVLSGSRTIHRPARPATYVRETLIARPHREVFDFCLSPEGFQGIMPDRIEPLESHVVSGGLGDTYVFRWWMRNVIPMRWAAHIDHYVPGREFVDLQLRGMFRYFRHTHTCLDADGGTLYRDHIEYATALGGWLDRSLVRRELNSVFARRHQRMKLLLEGTEGVS